MCGRFHLVFLVWSFSAGNCPRWCLLVDVHDVWHLCAVVVLAAVVSCLAVLAVGCVLLLLAGQLKSARFAVPQRQPTVHAVQLEEEQTLARRSRQATPRPPQRGSHPPPFRRRLGGRYPLNRRSMQFPLPPEKRAQRSPL